MISKSEHPIKERLNLFGLAPIVFLVFTFVFYGPLGLYLPNSEDIWVPLKYIFLVVSVVSFAAVLLMIVLLLILPEKLRKIYVLLIYGGAIGIYIQGAINIKYGSGVLDGSTIDWSQYNTYGIIDSFVWLFCLALPFIVCIISREKGSKILIYAALFLTAVQIPAMIMQLANYKPYKNKDLVITTDGIFEFGNKDNVLIIIPDTLDDEYTSRFLSDHPDYKETLRGFTNYRDNISSGARTTIAIPTLLTGIPFEYESSYSEYVDSVWRSDNPLKLAANKGVDVRVYSKSQFFAPSICDYVQNISMGGVGLGSFDALGRKIYKITGYTYFPHYLKRWFVIDTESFDDLKNSSVNKYKEDDVKFYNLLKENGVKISDSYDSAIRVYHMRGPHPPYHLDENGEFVENETDVDTQTAGVFHILEDLFSMMKEKGIYDDATIVITGDHGDIDLSAHSSLLVKMPGNNADYTESYGKSSGFDIPVLLYDHIGEKPINQTYGMKLADIENEAARERHFFRNETGSMQLTVNEYVSTGSVNELELFREHIDQRPVENYIWGTELSFLLDATANKYCTKGFKGTSGFQTFMRGSNSVMEFPLDSIHEEGNLLIDFDLAETITEDLPFKILINGKSYYEGNTGKLPENLTVVAPMDEIVQTLSDNKLIIAFDFYTLNDSENVETFGLRKMVMNVVE